MAVRRPSRPIHRWPVDERNHRQIPGRFMHDRRGQLQLIGMIVRQEEVGALLALDNAGHERAVIT